MPPKREINICSYAYVIVGAMEREICISLNGYVCVYIYFFLFESATLTLWHCN